METQTTALKADVKTKLLDAALLAIRTKGYAATTVDDICRLAGVSKGSFFHYFSDKEALAIAAAGHFGAVAIQIFGSAPYRDEPDPRERVLMKNIATAGVLIALAQFPAESALARWAVCS